MSNHVVTQFDIPEMLEVYSSCANYEVLDLNLESNLCLIYFSSHNIYFPDTDESFHQKIVEDNRFEWKRNILNSARKVIFVRDIKKQWYLEGISFQINTVETLAELLKKETEGLKVICVGNSAGGFAAILIGCLIKASHVLSFSGQFSLWYLLNAEESRAYNPTLVKYQNIAAYSNYYSLIDTIRGSEVPIFYFYPAKSDIDIEQAKLVRSLKEIFVFAFDTKLHGKTCFLANLIDLLRLDLDGLMQLHHKWKGKTVNPIVFSIGVSGYKKTLAYLLSRIKKKLMAGKLLAID